MDAAIHTGTGELADRLLAGIATRAPDPDAAGDWGVPLLARLCADRATDPSTVAHARRAAIAWASGLRGRRPHPGLFGAGLTGTVVGLGHASVVEPRLDTVAAKARQRLVEWSAATRQRDTGVGWRDYDLIFGAAGVVLGLASLPGCRPEHLRPSVRHLLRLCDSADLTRLVVGDDANNPMLSWNLGQLNYGLGHGIPGVLAALLAAWPVLPVAEHDELATAIGRVAGRLARVAQRDARGVLTWAPGSATDGRPPGGASRRQAWCYGSPGVARQLVEAGRVLDDPWLRDLGTAAMASFCAAWDDDYYLDTDTLSNRLAFCHGAAGLLATATAFGGHPEAGALGARLALLLDAELSRVDELAETDLTMLSGATGVLAVLLSGSANRGWLATVALAGP